MKLIRTAILASAALPAAVAAQSIKAPTAAKLNVADLQRRYGTVVSPTLRARVAKAPARWTIDPSVLKLAPQAVADAIAADIKTRMAGKSVGYSVTVVMPGGATASANGGMARRAPDGAPRAWTENDRISIASVSKPVTAAAVVRVMAAKGLSLDQPAWQLLPADWTYSDAFKTITVRELLSHDSGLRDCHIWWEALKSCAAASFPASQKNPSLGMWTRYSNANYAFLRLILSRAQDGKTWPDAASGPRYWVIVNDQVMKPGGLGGADCASPSPNPALSYLSTKDDMVWNSSAAQNYDFAAVKPGNDWGDMTPVCGSQGWNMSSKQLATFAHALMTTDKLVPADTATMMRQQELGLMFFDYSGGLTAYGHGGYHPGPQNGGEVNTLILTFNNGVSVGAVINSRYKGDFGSDIAEAVRAKVQ